MQPGLPILGSFLSTPRSQASNLQFLLQGRRIRTHNVCILSEGCDSTRLLYSVLVRGDQEFVDGLDVLYEQTVSPDPLP